MKINGEKYKYSTTIYKMNENNKKYNGKTTNFEERIEQHLMVKVLKLLKNLNL